MNKGGTDSNRDDVPNEVPIVVEAYGFKVDVNSRPDDLGEQPPSSWKDVPGRVNQHLMRIAVAPTRLVAEALEGVTRLIRGLSRLPSSIVNRVQRAHFEADAIEGQRQQIARGLIKQHVASAKPRALLTDDASEEDKTTQAVEQIQALLQKYKDKGLDAYVMFGSDGKPIIVLGVPPQSDAQVLEAIKQTKKFLSKSTEHEP
jgi:hypothetical protein